MFADRTAWAFYFYCPPSLLESVPYLNDVDVESLVVDTRYRSLGCLAISTRGQLSRGLARQRTRKHEAPTRHGQLTSCPSQPRMGRLWYGPSASQHQRSG